VQTPVDRFPSFSINLPSTRFGPGLNLRPRARIQGDERFRGVVTIGTVQNGLGLLSEFARLVSSSGHILQLKNGLEDLGDGLGHPLCAHDAGQGITTDVMLPGTTMIDRRELRKRTLPGDNKNYSDRENSRTHVCVRARDIGVDQVTSPVT